MQFFVTWILHTVKNMMATKAQNFVTVCLPSYKTCFFLTKEKFFINQICAAWWEKFQYKKGYAQKVYRSDLHLTLVILRFLRDTLEKSQDFLHP